MLILVFMCAFFPFIQGLHTAMMSDATLQERVKYLYELRPMELVYLSRLSQGHHHCQSRPIR